MNSVHTVGIVLHFRSAEMTLGCLESVFSSGLRHVVLVDNSQDDGFSLSEMAKGLDALVGAGLRVDIEEPGRNLGFAAGVNRGARRALTEGSARLLLVNSDARLTAPALDAMHAAISGGSTLVAPMVGASVDGIEPTLGYQRWLGLRVPLWVPGCVRYLSGACLMISERTISPRLFDEAFFFYGEDVELSARVAGQGGRLTVLKDVFVEHHASGSSKNGSWFYEYSMVRGHWLLARKLTRGRLPFVAAVVGRGPALLSRALLRSIRARRAEPILALFTATLDLVRGVDRDVTPPADVRTIV